ncbi:MAG: quinolinate synthase NadA [Candidatus Omnitrophica bacterium]|nr:quinolinate synthase NadA [Candidatus Omnitrophota bacterium]MCM8833459.1 quinolinate synthase NadA [Candidatus Omnitrophota bacterium]
MIEEILKLKKEKKAIILAHNYQIPEIQDIADFVGDSLELAKKASEVKDAKIIVFCGVKFMAETAKILSPSKKVLLPDLDAGCPLADMAKYEDVLKMKNKYPDAWVISYVNTNADVKSITDVCCTSANAEKVVKNVPAKRIIFLPDKNLCWYVKQKVPEKEIICWDGYCFVHRKFNVDEVKKAREIYPTAEIIVHPECDPEVQKLADGIYSTSGMIRRAKESNSKIFIIGTEEGLLHRLKKENPEKEFYSLGTGKICPNMKKITIEKLYESLRFEKYEINLSYDIIEKAKNSLEKMLMYI